MKSKRKYRFGVIALILNVTLWMSDNTTHFQAYGQRTGTENNELPLPKIQTGNRLRSNPFEERLVSYANELEIPILKHSKLTEDELELRYWVGFGQFSPRCLVYRTFTPSASFFSVNPSQQGIRFLEKTLPLSVKDQTVLSEYLSNLKLLTRRFDHDLKHVADPDEETVVVEIKKGTTYRTFYYPVYTKSKAGEKIVDLGKQIQRMFSVKLFLN